MSKKFWKRNKDLENSISEDTIREEGKISGEEKASEENAHGAEEEAAGGTSGDDGKKSGRRQFFKNRHFKKGLFSAVAVVLVLIIAVAANALITWKDFSVDVTSNQLYTLSDQTKSIVKALDQEVTFYVINSESDVNGAYEQIFNEYKKLSSNIKIEYRDPDLYPNFTEEYVDDPESVSADSVIVVCGDKSRYISSDDFISYSYSSGYSYSADSLQVEQLLTEAINYVTSDETPVVYTLSGHSEKDLSSDVISSFEGDNYAVETLSLLSAGAVPDDCDILLINGPQTDITEDEKAQIETYMANGGKMYVFLDASVDDLPQLYSLLEEYDVGVEPGVVVETDSTMYTQYPIYLLPEIESSDVTQAQYDSNVYILAPSAKGLVDRSAGETDEDTTAAEESTDGSEDTDGEENTYTVTSLLSTSDGAYSKVDTDSSTIEKEDGDIDGPFSIAMAVSDDNGGRLIVAGCSNMLESSIDYAVGGANTDFVLNGINYLSQQESKISIRAKDLSADTAIVPAFSQKVTLIGCVFVLPVLLLAAGIIMVVRRRRL